MITRLALLSVILFVGVLGLVCATAGGADKPSSPAKPSRAEIDKLIEQLKSDKFKDREEAMRRLMECDEALPALRLAAKSEDAEIQRRARKAMEAINKRLAKRALRRAAGLLKKGQTDQFVEQAVRWREYMDEDCWKAAVDHVRTINDEAVRASGGQFKLAQNVPRIKPTLPWIDISKLHFVHTDHLKTAKGRFIERERIVANSVKVVDGFVRSSFIICNGSLELKYSLGWSVVFVNGNLKVGDGDCLGTIGGSVVICDGDVVTAGVVDSIVLCTGNISLGAAAKNSVILSGGDVRMGVYFPRATAKDSVIRAYQRDPLHFVHFFDPEQVGIKVKSAKKGIQVEALAAAKSFARAGVRNGDLIVAVDGVKVDSAEIFRRLLRRWMQQSKSILLEIQREDKLLRIEVHNAGEAP